MSTADDDYAEHKKTYDYFVKGVALFTLHVAVILLLLAAFLT